MHYDVYVELKTGKYISVEAESKEEAEEKAKTKFIAEEKAKTKFIDDFKCIYIMWLENDVTAEADVEEW